MNFSKVRVSQAYTKNRPTKQASLHGWRKPGSVLSRILWLLPMAQKGPCTRQDRWHFKIDWCVWKLALLAFAVRPGLLHAMKGHSEPRAAGSTGGYSAQWLCAEAACLALPGLQRCSPVACQPPAWETMEGSARNLPRATPLPALGRWSPAQHPQLSSAPARSLALTWPWSCQSLEWNVSRAWDLSFPSHALKHHCLELRGKETVSRRWEQMAWPSLPAKLIGSRWPGEHKLSLLIQGSVKHAKKKKS